LRTLILKFIELHVPVWFYWTTILLNYSSIELRFYWTKIIKYWTTILMNYDSIQLQIYWTTILLNYNSIELQFYWATILLNYDSIELWFFWIQFYGTTIFHYSKLKIGFTKNSVRFLYNFSFYLLHYIFPT